MSGRILADSPIWPDVGARRRDGAPGTAYIRSIRRLLLTFAIASLALPATAVAAQPNSAQRALERRLGPQAVVDIDVTTGTPRVLARLDGTLTGAASGAPEDVAIDYVQRNLDVLGLTSSDLSTLEPPETSTAGGVTSVRWRQAVDGIPAADTELRVNLTSDGRVLNVLGSPAPDLDPDTTPSLTAGEAVRAVQGAAGSYRALPRDSGPAGPTRATSYVDGTDAELALFKGRLAWRVMLHASSRAVYDAFVDAETGRVLRKHNMVKSAAGDAFVWERYPGAAVGGTAATRNLIAPGWLSPAATTLNGTNVHAWSDFDDSNGNGPGAGEAIIRKADLTFEFPFTPPPWTFGVDDSWRLNRSQNGVQAFYYANLFHDHLRDSTVAFGAHPDDKPFEGDDDELLLQTDDGADTDNGVPDDAHINNANMLTPPDGQSPVMQMYLWSAAAGFRDANSGDDAAILYHEYTHGLSNRLVVDAGGFGALNTAQAGAMGEGWGDWYAQDFIVSRFTQLDDPNVPGQVDMGEYLDPTDPRLLREQALDCPVNVNAGNCSGGGFTYADFGRIAGRPEVHADGEIWAQTLWDLRNVVGPAEARRLVTQAMRLSPPEPSFLDMRNAIVQATASSAQRTQTWQVFANRGMGFYAATTGSTDGAPIPDTAMPPAPGTPRGRITGTVVDAASGAALNGVKATIGGHENGPEPFGATTAGAGAFAIERVPEHDYPSFVFKAANGYDQLVTAIAVVGGGTTTLAAKLRRNWAAASGGANSDGDNAYANIGCGTFAAIDQNPGAGWSTDINGTGEMIVTLPQAVNVTSFGIDPTATCGDDEVAGTRKIRIETSTSAAGGTFVNALTANDEFLPFRELDEHSMIERVPVPAARNNVRRVKVTLLANSGGSFFDLSEFAVYAGPDASVTVTEPPEPTPTPTATPSPTPIPTAIPTVVPTPTPTVTPPPARPSFTLPKSAKRSGVRFKVNCRADCRVTARLVVARSVARRLGLGRSRVAGRLTRNVKGGTRTLTLKLNSKASRALRRKVRSFRGTLRVSAAYAGVPAVSRSRAVTVKR